MQGRDIVTMDGSLITLACALSNGAICSGQLGDWQIVDWQRRNRWQLRHLSQKFYGKLQLCRTTFEGGTASCHVVHDGGAASDSWYVVKLINKIHKLMINTLCLNTSKLRLAQRLWNAECTQDFGAQVCHCLYCVTYWKKYANIYDSVDERQAK